MKSFDNYSQVSDRFGREEGAGMITNYADQKRFARSEFEFAYPFETG